MDGEDEGSVLLNGKEGVCDADMDDAALLVVVLVVVVRLVLEQVVVVVRP